MTTLGKYELHEQLGKGAFGTVYRTVDTELGREVAVKLLHPILMEDDAFITRFRMEARTLAALDHPNIVTIHEMGEKDGRMFIVMKYLPGGSLKELIRKKGALPFEKALSILKQVADGLDYAHGRGLVHRDIKPENILFDSRGEAVLTDFGLVRESSSYTPGSAGTIIGTPAYLAPEIWSGEPSSPASDIYALGCILYEMLTGEVLFEGKTSPEVMNKHFEPIKLPAAWSEGTPAGTDKVLKKALAKTPGSRFQSGEAFVSLLEKINDDEPPGKEHPEPIDQNMVRLKKILKLLIPAIMVAGLIIVFFITIFLYLWFIEKPNFGPVPTGSLSSKILTDFPYKFPAILATPFPERIITKTVVVKPIPSDTPSPKEKPNPNFYESTNQNTPTNTPSNSSTPTIINTPSAILESSQMLDSCHSVANMKLSGFSPNNKITVLSKAYDKNCETGEWRYTEWNQVYSRLTDANGSLVISYRLGIGDYSYYFTDQNNNQTELSFTIKY